MLLQKFLYQGLVVADRGALAKRPYKIALNEFIDQENY